MLAARSLPDGAGEGDSDGGLRADVVAQANAALAVLAAAKPVPVDQGKVVCGGWCLPRLSGCSSSKSKSKTFPVTTPSPVATTPARMPRALIVDGAALGVLLDSRWGRRTLLALAMDAESVMFCRVSPLQKALVARLLREARVGVTLAIGDGANDVGMIQVRGRLVLDGLYTPLIGWRCVE